MSTDSGFLGCSAGAASSAKEAAGSRIDGAMNPIRLLRQRFCWQHRYKIADIMACRTAIEEDEG